MTKREIDLVGLMELVRAKTLPMDWAMQRNAGERRRAFSRSDFDERLNDARPMIGSASFLKKIYNYNKHNENVKLERGVGERQVMEFLHYIFKDDKTPTGWPNTIKAFKEYQDGDFYPLIRGYELDFRQEIQPTEIEIEGEAAHLQLIQMAIKSKTLYEKAQIKKATAEQENEKLRAKINQQAAAFSEVREKVAVLESLLKNKSGDKKQIEKALEEIKLRYS